MDMQSCPCKRIKCERHGDCEACRAYHLEDRHKLQTACERLEAKAKKPQRKRRRDERLYP